MLGHHGRGLVQYHGRVRLTHTNMPCAHTPPMHFTRLNFVSEGVCSSSRDYLPSPSLPDVYPQDLSISVSALTGGGGGEKEHHGPRRYRPLS